MVICIACRSDVLECDCNPITLETAYGTYSALDGGFDPRDDPYNEAPMPFDIIGD